MTTAADQDLRPTLEGTLADFPIAELLGLLAATRQTGTLQVAVSPAALITIVDGRVAFAATDPASTVRDLLLDSGAVTPEIWQRTVKGGVDVARLGDALVDAGADRDAVQLAVRDRIVSVCESILDQPGARFRFVRQNRSSMGEAYTCTAATLREKLVTRAAEWERLRAIVPSDRAEVVVRPALASDCDRVEITRADWPVLLAVGSPTTPAALDRMLGAGIFPTTQALVRLWESGTVVIDGRVAPSADGDGHVGLVGGAPAEVETEVVAETDDPFTTAERPHDATDEATDDEPAADPAVEPAPVAGERVDEFDELRAAFSSF